MNNPPTVFLSYKRSDAEWTHKLATDLERDGFEVFLDDQDITAGDELVSRLEQGLARASSGLIVYGPRTEQSAWVAAEYEVLVQRAVEHKLRLAAVLLADVDLPPFLNTWVAADFRNCRSDQDYRQRLDQLERALRGERPLPIRADEIPVPGDLKVRREGPRRVTVRVTGSRVSIRAGEHEAVRRHQGEPDHRVTDAWWEVRRDRQRAAVTARSAGPARAVTAAPGLGAASQTALLRLGRALGNQFLAGAVGELLESELAEAERKNAALQIALEVVGDSSLQALPWEALSLPGREQPLVLHPRTQLHRFVTGLGSTPDIRIPGPLRILAAIGAPEADDEALDYEAELDRIVRAVERARREERARVRVLEWGSVPAIRDALREERFHILHVSCRASPSALMMETADGHADPVTALRLADEILVPDQGVPLVVLAGSSTALESSGDPGNAALPSLARGLLTRGVPAVLAMTSDVSDRYAIQLASRFYRSLASRQQAPDCLAAFSEARRELEGERQKLPPDDPQAALAEWWTPALYLRTESRPLFGTSEGAGARRPAQAGPAIGGITPRGLDDFVGRRADLRVLSQVLRSDEPAAIVYGIGGMGKTSLASRLMTMLSGETDLVVFIRGRTTPTEILREMSPQLRALRVNRRLDRGHELDLVADELQDPRQGWRDQLALVERTVLPDVSALIVLDEAEQNAADPGRESPGSVPSALADPELAAFIVRWTELGARARLLITSRHPLDLPEAAGRVTEHHLGPLSRGETDKLMWRLEALGALERPERDRAYADVGGHPRALEYVDSLLRGGRARFRDVASRMEAALRARGIADPSSWLARGAGDLNQALAETVTLIVDDVLVDRLLARLQPYPLARQLFVAASVFRTPIDADGLNWAVAESLEPDSDTGRVTRTSQAYRQLEQAQRERTGFRLRDLGLAPDLLAQLYRDCAAGDRPSERPGLTRAIEMLVGMFLLTEAHGPDGDPRYVVHRWTARGLWYLIQAGLAGLVDATELTRAHGRAAAYYEWRAERYGDAVADLLEARFHRREAGDLERAASLTLRAAAILFRWGEFGQIQRLCAETLQEVAADARPVTELLLMQSRAAQARGDYRAAEQFCRACLAAASARADRRWITLAHERLAGIAAAQGNYASAWEMFRTAIDLARDLRDGVLEARCYQGFGAVALALGNLDEAARFSNAARRNAADLKLSQHFFLEGTPELAQLARASGDLAAAERLAVQLATRQQDARDLEQVIGQSWLQIGQLQLRRDDTREAAHAFEEAAKTAGKSKDQVLLKDCYLQLGRTWQRLGKPGPAMEAYLKYIKLADQMGDRPGMADCYHRMGELDLALGDADDAAGWHERALRLASELEQPGLVAQAHLRLGAVHLFRGDAGAARSAYARSAEIGRGSGDPQILVASLLGLAGVELAAGAPDNAEDIYRDCRRVASQVGDQDGMARCQLGLGQVDRMRGDYGDAAHDFQEARQAAVQLRNPALEAECLRELGATAQDDGRTADAHATYVAALRLADQVRDAGLIADLCRRLGRLTPGPWGRKEWYQRAADRLQELGHPGRSAELCLEMAGLIAHADLAEAESCCRRALDLVDGDERSGVTVLAHVELARCARREGAHDRAASECAQAIELAEGLERAVLIAPACQEGGLISQLAGDPGHARELHRRALSRAEDAADTETVIAACRDLGRLARRDGHDTGEDSVESWYGRALSLAEAAGDERTAIACAQQLALSAMRRGAPEDARRLAARWPELCGPFGENEGSDPVLAWRRADLGAEFTDSGRPDEAVGFTAVSLLALIEIDAQSAHQQAALLQRQRAELGTGAFAALLAEHAAGAVLQELMKTSDPAASPGQDSQD